MNDLLPFLKKESKLYAFRWFILIAALLTGLLFYSDISGWRIFNGSSQQQWTPGGPGYHK